MSAGKEYKHDTVFEHDFDGIQEYDNRLPNWWLWTLWGTIVFSLGYWLIFHTYGVAKLPVAAYEAEMASAGGSLADLTVRGLTAADLEAFSTDQVKLAEGREVFVKNCRVCHLDQGQGLVGPNLTDDYWIHGGDALSIHNTIVHGVVDKGMAAWGRQLGADRVDAVVAYLLTLRGTNVEGKEPQGELWTPESAAAEAPVESVTERTEEEAPDIEG